MLTFLKHIRFCFISIILMLSVHVLFGQQLLVNGKADLTSFDFKNSNAELTGSWAFAWQEFLPPYKGNDLIDSSHFFAVPQLWNNKIINGKMRNGEGFATYYAEFKVPENMTRMALRMQRIESAYKLYINDSLYISSGTAGKNFYSEKAQKKNIYIVFPVTKGKFSLTFHVSNYHHKKGGFVDAPVLGLPETVLHKSDTERGFDAFLAGALLIVAFYHLGIFFLRRKEFSALFFGGMAAAVVFHRLTNGELLINQIFPAIEWELILKIDYIALFLQLAFFLLFFLSFFRAHASGKFIKIFVGLIAAMIPVVLLTPARIYTHLLIYIEFSTILSILYVIYIQIVAIKKRQQNGLLLPFFGTIILLFAAVNDELLELEFIQSRSMFHFGMLIFVFFQSYLLSFKFSALISQNEILNKRLLEIDAMKNLFMQRKGFDLRMLLQTLIENFGGDRAQIISVNNNEHSLRFSYPGTEKSRHDYPEVLIDKIISKREVAYIHTKSQAETMLSFEYMSKASPKSAVGVPIIAHNQVKHVIYIENYKQENSFGPELAQNIDLLANQIAGLIENHEIYGRLESLNTNLEEIIEQRTAELMQQREELHTQRDAIEQQNTFLTDIYKEISEKNKIMKLGIQYAKRIHAALMPGKHILDDVFPENFVFFRPKDILSGDFFWTTKLTTHAEERKIFTVSDCTGHGVPGALMSIIGSNLLHEATLIHGISEPGKILDFMQLSIREKLNQYDKSDSKDGMDMTLIAFDSASMTLQFAAARNPMLLVRAGKVIEYKADKMSIGGAEHARIASTRTFETQTVQIEKGDVIYLFSDGYLDQTGGEHGRKFMKPRFMQLISYLHPLPLKTQHYQLSAIFEKWKGQNIQLDDVTVAAIRF